MEQSRDKDLRVMIKRMKTRTVIPNTWVKTQKLGTWSIVNV